MLNEAAVRLLNWYQLNKRDLPWRAGNNPYYIWVSEIMLQQTRVEAVKPYFQRFLTELPTVRDLAECPEEKLLKLWEGLGYYNRVRNMQKSAQIVVNDYGGKMPASYEQLLALPGIGSYTAGAIASIAYGIAVPAVDGNVLRILSRINADPSDIAKQSVKKQAEQTLLSLMNGDETDAEVKAHPGELNQAWMDLGAGICLPGGEPACERCPLKELCRAHEKGQERAFPVKSKKLKRRLEDRTILLVQDSEKIALHKRPSKGLLAGLYEFPNLEGHLTEEEALQYVEKMGLFPVQIRTLDPAKHIFSHVEWHMKGYLIRVASFEGKLNDNYLLAEVKTVEEQYAIPSAFSAYTRCLALQLGPERARKNRRRYETTDSSDSLL
ncbi:MAG: A/G-specific adenine glycosylase [Lachnospiraceae bacterium]|nr:A/G-specific adenine glycosylase [Lachnospiraceae bacterium]